MWDSTPIALGYAKRQQFHSFHFLKAALTRVPRLPLLLSDCGPGRFTARVADSASGETFFR